VTPRSGSGSEGDPLERLVGFGEPTLDNEQVTQLGGAERDVADRLWRALGFPDVPEGELAFTDDDARALRLATEGLAQLTSDRREHALALMLHEARIISASLANLAEIELDTIGALLQLGLRQQLLRTLSNVASPVLASPHFCSASPTGQSGSQRLGSPAATVRQCCPGSGTEMWVYAIRRRAPRSASSKSSNAALRSCQTPVSRSWLS